jgi:hypothetical protein
MLGESKKRHEAHHPWPRGAASFERSDLVTGIRRTTEALADDLPW